MYFVNVSNDKLSYNKFINKEINKYFNTNFTIDVFDTLLIRKIRYEKLQFYKHAEKLASILKSEYKITVNPSVIVDIRTECRRFLDSILIKKTFMLQENKQEYLDPESNILEIFKYVLKKIFENAKQTISNNELEKLLETSIKLEIDLEKDNLYVNEKLITLMKKIIENNNKIYLISDIYLLSSHIKDLLIHFNIQNYFCDVFTSGEIKYGKYSTKIYKYIKNNNLINNYSFVNSVHIGDNKISDFISPTSLGINSYLLRNNIFNSVKNYFFYKVQKINFKIINKINVSKNINNFENLLKSYNNQKVKSEFLLNQIGYKLAPAILYYLYNLINISKETNRPVFLITSESLIFYDLLKLIDQSYTTKHVSIFKEINRRNTFLYYIFNSISETQKYINYDHLHDLCFKGEKISVNAASLYKILFSSDPKENNLDILQLKQSSSLKFLIKFKEHIKDKLKNSQEIYKVDKFINSISKEKSIILADLGWSGTIHLFIESILQQKLIDCEIESIFLGKTKSNYIINEELENVKGIVFNDIMNGIGSKIFIEEIWEAILTNKNNDEVINCILNGIKTFIKLYIEQFSNLLTVNHIYNKLISNTVSLINNPSFEEAKILGNIQHEIEIGGYKILQQVPLFNMSYTRNEILRYIFFKRKMFYEIYNTNNYWPAGFLSYYNIQIFAKFKKLLK